MDKERKNRNEEWQATEDATKERIKRGWLRLDLLLDVLRRAWQGEVPDPRTTLETAIVAAVQADEIPVFVDDECTIRAELPVAKPLSHFARLQDLQRWFALNSRSPFGELNYPDLLDAKWPPYLAPSEPLQIAGRRLWRLSDAVEAIATMPNFGVSTDVLLKMARRAATAGRLTVRDPEGGEPRPRDRMTGFLVEWTFAEDFNAWLEIAGYSEPYRLTATTLGGASGSPVTRNTSEDAIDEDGLGLYLGLELWSLREAAYLLCGQEPRAEVDFVREDRDGAGAVAQAYRRLKDATLAGGLSFVDADGAFMRRRVRPADARAWAELTGIKLSDPPPAVQATAEEVAALQAQGFYSVQEAAEVLAELHPYTRPADWVRDMREAHDRGELIIRSHGTRMRLSRNATRRDFLDLVKSADVNAWLQNSEAGIEFPQAPSAATAAIPEPAAEKPDPQRRLDALRALGGDVRLWGGRCQIVGIGKLVAREKAEERKRADAKTIRADLRRAAEAEKREGKSALNPQSWHP